MTFNAGTRTARRMPGIAIERAPVPSPRVLPRMDVAGFVGLAAAGPLNVPVPVADYAGFVEVFGGQANLAWDPGVGSFAHAQLGPAVRAYFAGGGRRAYVVRVAHTPDPDGFGGQLPLGAERSRFQVPGLACMRGNEEVPGELVARSFGSWADDLAVGASLSSRPVTVTGVNLAPDGALDHLRISSGVAAGDLLRWRWGSDGRHCTGYLPVLSVRAAESPGTPGGPADQLVRIDVDRCLWRQGGGAHQLGQPPQSWSALKLHDRLERLNLQLVVHGTPGQTWVLGGLGFVPGHPRYLGGLPTDEDLYRPREQFGHPVAEVWSAASNPRFPLAGKRSGDVYYPWDVDVVPHAFAGALASGRPALERDGLASLHSGLFIDPDLADVGVARLLAQAQYLRWQSANPRPLRGVHALLDIDEVTFVAVPDAGQQPWGPGSVPEIAPPPREVVTGRRPLHLPPFADCAPPELTPAPELSCELGSPPLGPAQVRLAWTQTPGTGVAYRVQVGVDPRSWDGARDVYLGARRQAVFAVDASQPRFFRVRAEAGARATEWSEGLTVRSPVGPYYVVDRGGPQPGGGGAAQAPPPPVQSAAELLAIHRCLLRMCAARGDLLAVLSCPQDFRAADAIAHADALRASGYGLDSRELPQDFVEPQALGFGALYHPWVGTSAGTDGPVDWVPPDGAVAGVIARRALARGAWVAPANERLVDVVALRRSEADHWAERTQRAQVNALRQTPVGLLCLSEDTLAGEAELRPVNVRRLISLIRRLAALEGVQYVFESNGPALRRSLERGFGEVLAFLFRLGAFAGSTPEQAFQVVVGDPPNTAQGMELGRLFVELKFAPSQPLEFLLVRLFQAGEHGFTLEGS